MRTLEATPHRRSRTRASSTGCDARPGSPPAGRHLQSRRMVAGPRGDSRIGDTFTHPVSATGGSPYPYGQCRIGLGGV